MSIETAKVSLVIPYGTCCMSQVTLCLYTNVVNETKPSQLKNCLVPVDIKNTIGCLGKKCTLIIKIILFVVNNNRSLC